MKPLGAIIIGLIAFILLSSRALFAPPLVAAASITITGPNGEDQNKLPSTQAKEKIWYNVKVSGLEPNKGYHLKIYKAEGYSPPKEGQHAEGTESLCGIMDVFKEFDVEAISDDNGEIQAQFGDALLPDNPPTGNFVFEVATAKRVQSFPKNDCVRGTYVAHTTIRIVDTPENYHPGSGIGSGTNPCSPTSCRTAFGNIPTDPAGFATQVLRIATGLAGGLALILMVIGSVRVLISSGDQQRLSAGRDMIVAAVAGLLFLIFSVLILQFIGVQILNITFT